MGGAHGARRRVQEAAPAVSQEVTQHFHSAFSIACPQRGRGGCKSPVLPVRDRSPRRSLQARFNAVVSHCAFQFWSYSFCIRTVAVELSGLAARTSRLIRGPGRRAQTSLGPIFSAELPEHNIPFGRSANHRPPPPCLIHAGFSGTT